MSWEEPEMSTAEKLFTWCVATIAVVLFAASVSVLCEYAYKEVLRVLG